MINSNELGLNDLDIAEGLLSDFERINTTPEHPFMTDRGWVEARDLRVGSRVLTKDNLYKIV